jgi:hypothetical protein
MASDFNRVAHHFVIAHLRRRVCNAIALLELRELPLVDVRGLLPPAIALLGVALLFGVASSPIVRVALFGCVLHFLRHDLHFRRHPV